MCIRDRKTGWCDAMSKSKIKTREKGKDIKVLGKSAVAGQRMKSAFIRSNKNAEALMAVSYTHLPAASFLWSGWPCCWPPIWAADWWGWCGTAGRRWTIRFTLYGVRTA